MNGISPTPAWTSPLGAARPWLMHWSGEDNIIRGDNIKSHHLTRRTYILPAAAAAQMALSKPPNLLLPLSQGCDQTRGWSLAPQQPCGAGAGGGREGCRGRSERRWHHQGDEGRRLQCLSVGHDQADPRGGSSGSGMMVDQV